jgi:diacylglycerol kinase (ATP)
MDPVSKTLKAALIVNALSGQRRKKRAGRIREFCNHLDSSGIELEILETRHRGHSGELAAQAIESGVDTIIVSGGDGTINEAIQSMAATSVRLAVFPSGTANVLARELHLPHDPLNAAKVVKKGRTRNVFIGCARDLRSNTLRYFLLMAGIGIDAIVAYNVNPMIKKYLGERAYWLSGFEYLARWKPLPFELEIEGERFISYFTSVANAAAYGGGLSITPEASMLRPDFEVCVVSTRDRLRYINLLIKTMAGVRTEGTPDVRFIRTTRVVAEGDVPVQVDGEVIGSLPMEFTIAPWQIGVLIR